MAKCSVIIDAVAFSQIVNEVDKQRRAKDFVAKLAVLKQASELNANGSKAGAQFLATVKILEDAGLSTQDAVITFNKILEAFEKIREENDNDT